MKTKILMKEFVTHDVMRFIMEKPKGLKFIPGQATDMTINSGKWKKKKNPFTFTCLNSDLVLEFTIKIYHERKKVTDKLSQLKTGTEIILTKPFGTINYKDPGIFIAGGAGITPFIAILRQLRKKGKLKGNRLIFSNKTKEDVILEKEFKEMFPNKGDLILTLTREKVSGYESGRINKTFLKKHIKNFKRKIFYICGPKAFVQDMKIYLNSLGAKVESVVFEK